MHHPGWIDIAADVKKPAGAGLPLQIIFTNHVVLYIFHIDLNQLP